MKMMKYVVACSVSLIMMAGWIGFFQPASVTAATALPTITITETLE